LRDPERIAAFVAPMMRTLAQIGGPAVWLLDASTRVFIRLFGQGAGSETAVTEEEIKHLVAEAEAAGVIEIDERRMIGGILRLSDRRVRALMTPRTEVDWISLADTEEEIRDTILKSP